MNPNTALEIALDWAEFIQDPESNCDDVRYAGPDLAQAVLDLHNWLKNGGALPKEWER